MTDQMSVSQPFRAMAARIDLNIGEGFSGAACIVPPGGGKHIEMLLLRNEGDEAQFWAMVKTQAEIAIQEIMNAQNSQPWEMRR